MFENLSAIENFLDKRVGGSNTICRRESFVAQCRKLRGGNF